MLDIQYIRDNPEKVAEKSKQKGYDVDVAQLLELDTERRTRLTQVEELRARRNTLADSLKSGKPTAEQIAEGKSLKEEVAQLELEIGPLEERYLSLLKSVPNMPLDMVPVGYTEEDNVVIRTVGEQPNWAIWRGFAGDSPAGDSWQEKTWTMCPPIRKIYPQIGKIYPPLRQI